nr:coat protein [Ranunculus leaf distortion virus]
SGEKGPENATLNAGNQEQRKGKEKQNPSDSNQSTKEPDVNVGSAGTFVVPKVKAMTGKLRLPKIGSKQLVNLDHLLTYTPTQVDLSNTRATTEQLEAWYNGVMNDYEVDDAQMQIILNGFMVWCIENGTSPNLTGDWVMMDGESQVVYPIAPMQAHAKPTLRQIMAHFSDLAEAYIEGRNRKEKYIPRYGIQRNLRDRTLARYAFDFYEITSKTTERAREAVLQMKAAALRNVSSKMFGLDGSVSTKEEDTERHTAGDVNRNMHTLLGVSM